MEGVKVPTPCRGARRGSHFFTPRSLALRSRSQYHVSTYSTFPCFDIFDISNTVQVAQSDVSVT